MVLPSLFVTFPDVSPDGEGFSRPGRYAKATSLFSVELGKSGRRVVLRVLVLAREEVYCIFLLTVTKSCFLIR